MKKKIFKIAGIVIIFAVLAGLIAKYIYDQKYLHQFDHLIEPKISTKPQQNMLVAYMKGDPSKDSGQAIGNLYKSIYKYKDPDQPPILRGRWQFNDKDNTATGQYGIPIKAGIKVDQDGVRSEIWEYGIVAEILHMTVRNRRLIG